MKSKKFTVWQLFSIVDGRMSTKVDDIYDILDTATGHSLMTHSLPPARAYFVKTRPQWYLEAERKIKVVKDTFAGNWENWEHVSQCSDMPFFTHEVDVVQIPDIEQGAFKQFMIDDSLILKIMNQTE